ncbi:MAG: hypothetical protein KDK91_04175 [Gammaproteobacteria bacterium]|nr:hypothetical protein [Gammaproteobacteria bacterium]
MRVLVWVRSACSSGPGSLRAIIVLLGLGASQAASALELGGFVQAQARLYAARPAHPGQRRDDASLVVQPELYTVFNDGADSLSLVPFLRLDSADRQRTHADLRELLWMHVDDGWVLRAGIGKVFWGVTESRHLVDVINQTDRVESLDGEQKLGQPLVNLAIDVDVLDHAGTLELFVLPGFRERTAPGRRGRQRSEPVIEVRDARYESSAGDRHVDFALRWSQVLGAVDLGIAHFHGTSREPSLLPVAGVPGSVRLVPRYEVMDQTSVDLQYTTDSWLYKLEAIRRAGQGPRSFYAHVIGVEYTRHGALGGRGDLGLLVEHLYDGRGHQASTPFEHDLFLGVRWAANDVQGSSLLAGLIQDLEGKANLLTLEAERRLGDRFKLEVNGRAWFGVASGDPQRAVEADDHLEVNLRYYLQ